MSNIDWKHELPPALAAARSADRLVLLDFFSPT